MSSYVLYHGNCYDGFGAAWSMHRNLGDDAIYIPVSYGHPVPVIPDQSQVYIVDFSYPRADLIALSERCELTVLDHHKTAQAHLEGLPFCTFDMERSGAMLAYNYCFPGDDPPRLIDYVQDRDLWRFALPESRAVSACIASYPFTFPVWDELRWGIDNQFQEFLREGHACLRLKEQYVNNMCRHPQMVELGGHTVPSANATVCFSEVGERLCELFPDAPFAAYYLDRNDGLRQWGLRSRGGFDVSVVAKQYGGGGHAAAAGFTTPLPAKEEVG